jgi:hypothetical protein
MHKTFALLLATAFVATLPSIASAKSKRHHPRHHRHVVAVEQYPANAGPRLVANALHQIFVPLEVTFGARQYR